MRETMRFALALGGVLAVATVSQAAIVAMFDQGNGNTQVDQYPGIAGDGWRAGWATPAAFDTGYPTVVNTNPLSGGGNYVDGKKTNSSTSQTRAAYYRQYSTARGVDLTQPHRIQFDYRVDVMENFNQGNNGDYFQAYENNTSNDFGGTGTWLVRTYGADAGGAKAAKWALYNGTRDGAGFDVNKFLDTGVALTAGTVYHFIVDVDPAKGDWDVAILYPGGAYTSPTLGYRGIPASVVADYVSFGLCTKAATAGVSEVMEFSADSINITPEPATMCLLGLGLAGLILRRKR